MFWELTFREIAAILEGVSARLRREHNDRAWMVWHTEALARQKKLPPLKDLTRDGPKRPRQMTAAEIEAVTRSWLSSRKKKQR